MKYFKIHLYISFILIIILGCEMPNESVELLSLVASDSVALSGDTVVLACKAQDGDGDNISYSWVAGDGELSVDKDTARWIAPGRSGYYHITCKVSDGLGSSDGASITIRVEGGVIQGKVTNAVNGENVPNSTITILDNTATTNEDGEYKIYIGLQSGEYQVNAAHDSFCPFNSSFQIPDGNSLTLYEYNFSMSPFPEPGEIRIVLNWGATPPDLDSHLKIPEIDGQAYHINYSNRGNANAAPFTTLDIDDTDGFGPETITIKQSFTGNYIYYVHQYSSSGSLQESGGVVQIYNSPECDGLSIQVPEEGEGRYWYVCKIDGENGEISVINQIQDSEPSN